MGTIKIRESTLKLMGFCIKHGIPDILCCLQWQSGSCFGHFKCKSFIVKTKIKVVITFEASSWEQRVRVLCIALCNLMSPFLMLSITIKPDCNQSYIDTDVHDDDDDARTTLLGCCHSIIWWCSHTAVCLWIFNGTVFYPVLYMFHTCFIVKMHC